MKWWFHSHELYLLGGLLQLPGFIGMEDPFPGFLIEEIQEHMEAARQSLIDRRVVEQYANGFVLDKVLMDALLTMGTASYILTIGNNNTSSYIHSGVDYVVLQECMQDGRISVSVYKHSDFTINYFMNLLCLPDVPASTGPSFSIEPVLLEEARGFVANSEMSGACFDLLVKKGLSTESAEALTKTLFQVLSTGSIVILERKGRSIEQSGGFAWVIVEQGGWTIEIRKENTKNIQYWEPASSHAVATKIEEIFDRLQLAGSFHPDAESLANEQQGETRGYTFKQIDEE
jgi:hypothetical protein